MKNPSVNTLVQINPGSLLGADPKHRKKLATIVSVKGPYPGQGERKFVNLLFQSGELLEGISSDLIELA